MNLNILIIFGCFFYVHPPMATFFSDVKFDLPAAGYIKTSRCHALSQPPEEANMASQQIKALVGEVVLDC